MKSIRPPREITRVPRSISEHLKYWKASELRSFLLFYSVPVLNGILNDDYFQHYMLFAQALFMIMQPTISRRSLNVAREMLIEFNRKFTYLYPKSTQTLNFHQLMHLCDDISFIEQLYMYSCFVYEGKNCHFMKFVSGTEHVDKQSISAVALILQ